MRFTSVKPLSVSFGYRLVRALARLRLSLRQVRVVGADRMPASGATLLFINSPARFRNVLLLVAAVERPVRWVLGGKAVKGWLARLMARWLGVQRGDDAAADYCIEALLGGGAVALFAMQPEEGGGYESAARLAIELGKKSSDPVHLAVHCVDVFDPPAGSRAREILIYVDGPLYPREYLHRSEGDFERAVRALAEALEEVGRTNAFRLVPVAEFLTDLEDLLRSDLREDWTHRPDGRQQTEDFELSHALVAWVHRMNALDPAQLVALRETVEAFRAARRRSASRAIQVETSGAWMQSPLRRAATWVESFLGLPVALYGLVNHLLAAVFVYAAQQLRKSRPPDQKIEWAVRGLMVLAGYAVQIGLCNHWYGRAVAGYYALTLPVSGAYLWRYLWLARHRTQKLLFRWLAPVQASRLRRLRRKVLGDLDRALSEGSALAPQ